MSDAIDSNYPSIEFLREKARRRMPGFAFDYLEGGCNSNINLRRNTEDIREIQLRPYYIRNYPGSDLKCELFGKTYDAPFGIAPIGLQGLMWPKSCEILAAAARRHNIPFILSTVGTASIETISEMVNQLNEAHRGQTESAGAIVGALEELAANTRRQRERIRI